MAVSNGKNSGQNQTQQNTAMSDAFQRAGAAEGAPHTQHSEEHANVNSTVRSKAQPKVQRSVVEANALMRRPMARMSGGERVMKFQDAIRRQIEEKVDEAQRSGYRLLTLDSNSNNIPMSCLVLYYHVQLEGRDYASVYTMIVESEDDLPERTYQFGSASASLETVAGDIYDDRMWERVETAVRDNLARPNLEIFEVGASVLPRELDPEDAKHVHSIVFNATQATFTVLLDNLGGDEQPFSADYVRNGDQLTARVDYQPHDTENAAGLPVRSDLNIKLVGAHMSDRNMPFEWLQSKALTTVDAYIDLAYDPEQQQQPMFIGQQVQQQSSITYRPIVVLTRLETAINAVTPELALMSLSTAILAGKKMAWAGVFTPHHGKAGDLDLKDVGAIGYDAGVPGTQEMAYIDVKDANGDKTRVYQLLSTFCHQMPVFEMDIEETGELSWLNQAFLGAAQGNPDAYAVLYNAANNLTLGHFQQYFQQGEPIAVDTLNRVQLGYWTDHNGNRRDIREFDYLAMLNVFGENNLDAAIEWASTWDNMDEPMELRLQKRRRIMNEITTNIVIKGYAQRIRFTHQFLTALEMACAAAGLTVVPKNMETNVTGVQRRGNPNIADFAMRSQDMGGMFSYGQPNYGGGVRAMGQHRTRFSR